MNYYNFVCVRCREEWADEESAKACCNINRVEKTKKVINDDNYLNDIYIDEWMPYKNTKV